MCGDRGIGETSVLCEPKTAVKIVSPFKGKKKGKKYCRTRGIKSFRHLKKY